MKYLQHLFKTPHKCKRLPDKLIPEVLLKNWFFPGLTME